MPESIESYAARLAAAAGPDGRLGVDPEGLTGWDTFPFETDGLRVRPLQPLSDAEPGRNGDDPATCALGDCPGDSSADYPPLWRNPNWQLKAVPPSGVPCVVILEPRAHLDLPDLSPELAAEFGQLTVAVTRAMEELPSVARAHAMRIGDGAVHLHLWFIARPARMPQFRGSFNVLWDDLAPAIPLDVRDENAAFVADRLVAAYGGVRV